MTLKDSIILLETTGLTKVDVGNGPIPHGAARVILHEGAILAFVKPGQTCINESSQSDLEVDEPPLGEGAAEAIEINQEDWEALLSLNSGRGERIDPLIIDWLKKAGLVEDSQGQVKLTQTAKDWINGTNTNFNGDETERREGGILSREDS